MERDTELDQLLSHWLAGRRSPAPEPLAPLLVAADALTPLRHAAPSAGFARRLEADMLRHARSLPAERASLTAATEDAGPLPLAPPTPPRRLSGSGRSQRAHRVLWSSVIAATLLCVIGSLFVVAADAQPGGPLYIVRRFEQTVRSQLTVNAAARAQLHLDNAESALQALDTAAAQREHGARLTDALDTFVAEHTAAATALAEVTDGVAHAKLAAALDGQRARATTDLRAALATQDWPLRLRLTQALSALGAVVPVVRQVTLSEAHDPADSRGDGRLTTVTITGDGFQPGARLLLRGAPVGATISVSGDTLIAQVRAAAQALASQGPIGVGNPDGTAAISKQVPTITSGAHVTPTADPTKNGDNGKRKPTPTP